MHVLSIALGGCLKAEPVAYGITEDTGGHITYVLGEMEALARRADISHAEIVTRRFEDARLGGAYAEASETIAPKCTITRIDSGNPTYLSKEALARDIPAFTQALVAELKQRPRLPDIVHAHFADAAEVAAVLKRELGIPFVYTAHSLGIDKRDCLTETCASLEARIAGEDRAIAAADAVVASSRDECERQILRYPSARLDRIHRLRPGTRQDAATEADREAASALIAPFLRHPEKPIVFAVARPVEKKNLALLVDAFGQNENLRERANLVLLAGLRENIESGEAEQRAVLHEILAAIDRHDLYGHVAYPKQHDRAAVNGMFALTRQTGGVFVNPALTEPYGLTLIEAATHGVPVVATRNGGPVDIVGELQHGVLVNPRDADDVGGAIERLLVDPAQWRAYSRAGRTNVMGMTWDAYAAGFARLARRITRPRPHHAQACRGSSDELLICDIDNTLTGCSQGAERLGSYLKRHPAIAFGVATGRSIIEAQRIRRDWALPMPRAWICSVGTEIYWPVDGGLQLDTDYADAIADGWQPEAIEDVLGDIPHLEWQPPYEQRAFKRSLFVSDQRVIAEIRANLGAAGLKVRLVHSHERLLDILPLRAGKAASVRHVARKLAIAPGRIVAAGDSGNDHDMLSETARAIMVGNHAEELSGLRGRANVYVAQRHHAAGTLEGLIAWRARDRQARRKDRRALELVS